MRPAEKGFLLLTSFLGNPERRPLSVAQFRTLALRVRESDFRGVSRELTCTDIMGLGYSEEMARRIVNLMGEEQLLERYLRDAEKCGCTALSRISEGYPEVLNKHLGLDSPGCLWVKGNLKLLNTPMISLVGSRDIRTPNKAFAREVGERAAELGMTLVSGNARGADRIAQTACLENGGNVVCVVADTLLDKRADERILFLSEDGYELEFSPQRALSRNRVIHALGEKTFVAQTDLGIGGTWDGSVKNLKNHWSPLFCFNDGSDAAVELQQMGATLVTNEALQDIRNLQPDVLTFFDH